MNNQKGFTLMELIITIALIGILSAIIVPNFMGTIQRAKLKVDIQSVQSVQNMIEVYVMEYDGQFPGGEIPEDNSDLKNTFKVLLDKGYMRKQDFDKDLKLILQVIGSEVRYRKLKEQVVLIIPHTLKDLYEQLSEREQKWVECMNGDM